MNLRSWIRPGHRRPILSPRGLLLRAFWLAVFFGICHLAGLRESTSFLCGMQTGPLGLAGLAGPTYLVAYLGFTLVMPILLLAAGLMFIFQWRANRPASHGSTEGIALPVHGSDVLAAHLL